MTGEWARVRGGAGERASMGDCAGEEFREDAGDAEPETDAEVAGR
jgi:hypothetical protein